MAAEQASMRARVRRVAGTDSLLAGDLEQQAPNRSIGGSWAIHARGSEVRPIVDDACASTGSAWRRWERACCSHTARLESLVYWARSRLAPACAVVTPPCAWEGVLVWFSGPRRSRAPPTTGPQAKMPAGHQYPAS